MAAVPPHRGNFWQRCQTIVVHKWESKMEVILKFIFSSRNIDTAATIDSPRANEVKAGPLFADSTWLASRSELSSGGNTALWDRQSRGRSRGLLRCKFWLGDPVCRNSRVPRCTLICRWSSRSAKDNAAVKSVSGNPACFRAPK